MQSWDISLWYWWVYSGWQAMWFRWRLLRRVRWAKLWWVWVRTILKSPWIVTKVPEFLNNTLPRIINPDGEKHEVRIFLAITRKVISTSILQSILHSILQSTLHSILHSILQSTLHSILHPFCIPFFIHSTSILHSILHPFYIHSAFHSVFVI